MEKSEIVHHIAALCLVKMPAEIYFCQDVLSWFKLWLNHWWQKLANSALYSHLVTRRHGGQLWDCDPKLVWQI